MINIVSHKFEPLASLIQLKLGQVVHAPRCAQLQELFTEPGKKPEKELSVRANFNPFPHMRTCHMPK